MKLHNALLTSVLLLLIGILIGILFSLYRMDLAGVHQPTEVTVTEIKRNMEPVESSEMIFDAPVGSVKNVAREVVPTVVYIETSAPASRRGREMPDDENHDFDDNFWDRFVPRGRSTAVGSGVIISPDGFIITNNHVIAGARDIRVTLSDKRQYEASIVGRDPSTDLAVLRIDGNELPHIIVGNSDHLEVGDWVMAVGNPLRLQSTITAGIVSALSRDVQIINDRMRIENFIQTDAAINKGNSGGALVNVQGELIGINTAIATESGSYQGYGFAIPINMAFKIARDLMEFGEVQRAYLGVQISSVNHNRARELGMDTIRGVEIVDLVRSGAGRAAGLRVNDIVLEINGVSVNESNQLQAQVAMYRPGDTIEVKVWRDGEILEKDVKLAGLDNQELSDWAAPQQEMRQQPQDEELEGMNYLMFNEGFILTELARPENPDEFEIVVTYVEPGSTAESLGLQNDDVVLAFNDEPIENLRMLEQKWADSDYAVDMFEIKRGDERFTIEF